MDVVVLANGDRLTGTVGTFADGVLTFEADMVGTTKIPVANITDLTTAGAVTLVTVRGERYKRRITGWKGGQVLLEGDAPALLTGDLTAINPPPKPAEKWTGTVNIGASLITGNTERRSATASVKAVHRSEIDRITGEFSWDYAEDKDTVTPGATWELTQRRTRGAMQYDYFTTEKSYLLATTEALGDTQADIDLRWSAGVGAGYQWYETDDFTFSTEAGLSYVDETYRSTNAGVNYVAARAAYKLGWQVRDGLEFLQDVIVTPSLEEKRDVTATKISRLQMSLTESMFTEFRWELDYDNTPAATRDRLDHRFFLTLGWTF